MGLIDGYHALIEQLSLTTGWTDTLLHIHTGLAIFILTSLLLRGEAGSYAAFLVTALAECSNELMDRLYYGDWRWTDTGADILHTLFWPAVLCIIVRMIKPARSRPVRARAPVSSRAR